jgi:regulator of replication initiation timing
MKSCLIVILFALGMALLVAQEPPLPAATSTPAPNPSVRPELNIPDIPLEVEPSPLVPNSSPAPKKNLPSISELDSVFGHSSLGQAVEEQRLHLEWRKLKNRASLDPEVIAAKKAVDTARPRTDVEKRNLMRAYYKVFYAHMQALAETPEIKPYLEQKKREALNSLAQPTLRPDPTPTPSPSATP